MSLERQIAYLADRAAIDDIVTGYATGVDERDWDLFRSLFKDRLFLDFSTFHPSLYREIGADELLEISMKVGNFDSTQHLIGNRRFRIEGDRASCIGAANCAHYIKRDGVNHCCMLHGTYTYEMERTSEGWKIDRYGLEVIGEYGNSEVFSWVGLR